MLIAPNYVAFACRVVDPRATTNWREAHAPNCKRMKKTTQLTREVAIQKKAAWKVRILFAYVTHEPK